MTFPEDLKSVLDDIVRTPKDEEHLRHGFEFGNRQNNSASVTVAHETDDDGIGRRYTRAEWNGVVEVQIQNDAAYSLGESLALLQQIVHERTGK